MIFQTQSKNRSSFIYLYVILIFIHQMATGKQENEWECQIISIYT